MKLNNVGLQALTIPTESTMVNARISNAWSLTFPFFGDTASKSVSEKFATWYDLWIHSR